MTAQLKQLYETLNQGALTAYFINPTKAIPLLQQQFTAAQIAAEGTRTGVGQLSLTQATTLAQQGVTDSQAAQGFGTLAQQQGLFQAQAKGEAPIDLNTQIAAQFDNSAAAQLRIRRAQESRLADFQGRAGENVTSQGVRRARPCRSELRAMSNDGVRFTAKDIPVIPSIRGKNNVQDRARRLRWWWSANCRRGHEHHG